MEIKVIRSWRRRRTASARIKNGVLYIRLPALIPPFQAEKIIAKFRQSAQKRKVVPSSADLAKHAQVLNQRYFAGQLKYTSICWSANQNSLHGSCSPRRGAIRISAKLKKVPKWVLDAILVHELIHLLVPNHGAKFWSLANRYPLMERARGYLMAIEKHD